MTFTHAELVQRAVRWLKGHHKCSLVYSEMTTGAMETPDAIGWRLGFSRLVEVKVSRADFLRDKKTKTGAMYAHLGLGGQRWYLVPDGMVQANEVPEWCGLAFAHKAKTVVVKEAPEREHLDFRGEIQMLTSAIRRMQLGSQFDPVTGRWESYMARTARQKLGG